MADDDKPPGRAGRVRVDDRDVRRLKTPPKGVAEQLGHERPSRAMPALARDEDDGTPSENIEESSVPIPTGLTPVQELQVQLARAMSRSNLALSEAQSVRAETRAEFTAMNAKFDTIAAQVSAASGEMRTVSGVLNRQLEASQKQQELVLAAMLGAQAANAQAKNDEMKASGAHKRSLSEKIAIALIGLVLAVQTYFFAAK